MVERAPAARQTARFYRASLIDGFEQRPIYAQYLVIGERVTEREWASDPVLKHVFDDILLSTPGSR